MIAKLLIMSIEQNLASALQDYLKDYGFEVMVAFDAKIAGELLQQDCPQAVIVDVILPQKELVCFLEQLRDDPQFDSLSVLFLIPKEMPEYELVGYEAPRDAYMRKPFDPDELISLIWSSPSVQSFPSKSVVDLSALPQAIQTDWRQQQLIASLEDTERSIWQMLMSGYTHQEIAQYLRISLHSVKKIIRRIERIRNGPV
jgi:DNA-binding NarL/FixJ family response regulator